MPDRARPGGRAPRARGAAFAIPLAAALAGTTAPVAVVAQARAAEPTVLERYTVADGLPVNAITSVLQARDGFLWIATFDGLARFDGVRFTTWSIANTPGLPTNRLIEMQEGRDGALWLVTEQRELVRFAHGRATAFGIPARVRSITEARDGTWWVATDRGVAAVRDGRWRWVAPGVVRGRVDAMVERTDGTMWIAEEEGRLFRVRDGRAVRLDDAGTTARSEIVGMHEGADGAMWIATTRGLVHWTATPRLVVADSGTYGRIAAEPVEFARSADGRTTWMSMATGIWRIIPGPPARVHTWPAGSLRTLVRPRATRDSGALFITPAAVLHVGHTVAGASPRVRTLIGGEHLAIGAIEDREGTVWVGTSDNGLLHLKRTPIAMAPLPPGLGTAITYAVTATRDGAIWYGSNEGDLTRLDPATGRATRWTDRIPLLAGGLPQRWIRTILEDRRGALWVGGGGFLARCDAHGAPRMRCTPVPEVSLGDGQTTVALHEARDGTLWVGTDIGLLARSPDGRWRRVAGAGVPTATVRAFAETPDGALWVGTAGGGLARVANGTWREVGTRDGLPTMLVRSLHVDAAGSLWIGTEGRGLAHLDPRAWAPGRQGRITVIDSRHGLFDDVLHMILPDDAGRLWFNTNRGIFHVARRELDDFVAGRTARVHTVSYTERDGLANREGNGGSQPAGTRTADGRLWFPTQAGVAIVDPARVARVAVPPPVAIAAIRAGDTTITAGDTLVAPGIGRRDLEVEYTAPSFVAPRALRFRYRLEPYDTGWVDAGARRTAFYTRVPPGRYTFRVLAGTEDGRWSARPATLALDIAPRWWETTTARVLALLAALVTAVAGVQWRLRLLRRRADELERVVTERTGALREREAQLASRNTQLAELVESRSRLFANLSHEFRTPLTLILGPLRSLLDGRHGPLGATVREQGELMERNGQRLLRLINQVLDLSRLQAGAVTLARTPRDLGAFVRTTTLAFAPLAERRRIAIAVEAPPAPVPVAFDGEQLEKVLLNLLSNAFKFTDPGGRVLVTVRADGDDAVVAVRDTGIGIDADVLPRVFDRFWQADASATRRHEGTGIGLALAKELVELHGGTIGVASTVGAGSTFTVRLPLLRDPAAVAAVERARDAGMQATPVPIEEAAPIETGADDAPGDGDDRTTVLHVDDNADVRAFVRSILGGTYRVIEAADGRAGLELARGALPDLIVADVMMPELDGLGLARALKDDAMTDAIPVVLLTARADTADQVAGLGTGADAYLLKPFEPAVLAATVASLLAQRRRLRERFAGEAAVAPGGVVEAARPTDVAGGTDADRDDAGDAMPAVPESIDDDAVPPREPTAFELRLRALLEPRLTERTLDHARLAALAGLSYHQLYRGLKEATGESPTRFIRRVRVERAAALLAARAGSVSEVAYSVGFESLSYFSRAFAERFGVPPSAVLRGEAVPAAELP